tara:strand:+ start:3946 stop:4170 length:225 start_codon:yes stop_codon:yes gene_type:complete
MKELVILIVMFFPDPLHTGPDAITINSFNGTPLVFNTEDDCEEWIWGDLENLKAYGLSQYPEAVSVKSISCVYP